MKQTPLKRKTPLRASKSLKRTPIRKSTKKRTQRRTATKKRTVTWYRKKLWKAFSLYIRTRDNFTCFTCDKKGSGGGMHAGHYIAQASCGMAARFNEDFTRAQCYNCNINQSGNHVEYRKRLIEKFGEEKVVDFENSYHIVTQWTPEEWETKIAYYESL